MHLSDTGKAQEIQTEKSHEAVERVEATAPPHSGIRPGRLPVRPGDYPGRLGAIKTTEEERGPRPRPPDEEDPAAAGRPRVLPGGRQRQDGDGATAKDPARAHGRRE